MCAPRQWLCVLFYRGKPWLTCGPEICFPVLYTVVVCFHKVVMCVVLSGEPLLYMDLVKSGSVCCWFGGKTSDKHGDLVHSILYQNLRNCCVVAKVCPQCDCGCWFSRGGFMFLFYPDKMGLWNLFSSSDFRSNNPHTGCLCCGGRPW